MKIFSTTLFSLLLLLLASFLTAKQLDVISLEKEICRYNREGRQLTSQKKLSDLLFSGNLSKEEESAVLLYMAITYRGVNDYMMCLDYLNKSHQIAQDLPKNNFLRKKLDYEYAFVYFDSKNFEKAKKAMERIADKNYIDVSPEDQSYILMQEGYLFLMDREFALAQRKYDQAFMLMRDANAANLPIILVKMMELYSKKNDINKVESLYKESMQFSRQYKILKYEIMASAEMERIYKEHNLLDKAYAIGAKLDSLRKLENLDSKVSEMHIVDKKYTEMKEASESRTIFWDKVGSAAIALILLSIIAYSFVYSRDLRLEKRKMAAEIVQMKEDMETITSHPQPDVKLLSTEHFFIENDKLTERQKELLKLISEGFSNKEIADKLFITESTVKYHVRNIYSILELKDRKDLFRKMTNN